MKLSESTIALLEDIESRIEPEVEEDLNKQWEDFLNNKTTDVIFTPVRKKQIPGKVEIPHININDAIEDYELMLVSQLWFVTNALNSKSSILAIRANYGTGILSSIFGAPLFVMPRHNNTLPTTKALDIERMGELIENGIPNLRCSLGERTLAAGEFFAEVVEKYPKIKKYVEIYHPDLQGPADILELLFGSEMYYEIYDNPDNIHAMLQLITDTYVAFTEEWRKIFPEVKEISAHWDYTKFKGSVLLRDVSAMNFSPELYDEFAFPYDSYLLKKYGGAVHFCGKGDHYIERLCEAEGLTAINMSQPQYNDMEKIYKATVDRGIKLVGFNRSFAERDVNREGAFHGNMHCN